MPTSPTRKRILQHSEMVTRQNVILMLQCILVLPARSTSALDLQQRDQFPVIRIACTMRQYTNESGRSLLSATQSPSLFL